MRGIGLVALLIAGAASACRSPPLVDRPDALGPSVIVSHATETDVEVPEEQSEVRSPSGQTASVASAIEPPVGRTSREGSERTRTSSGPAADETGLNGVSTTARLPPGRAPAAESLGPDTATPPGETQEGAAATTLAPPIPAIIEPVEGERVRSRTSTSPWPWAALAVLLVGAVMVLRRLRTRSRLRSRRFDPDDAWDVFQAGLAREPGEGG